MADLRITISPNPPLFPPPSSLLLATASLFSSSPPPNSFVHAASFGDKRSGITFLASTKNHAVPVPSPARRETKGKIKLNNSKPTCIPFPCRHSLVFEMSKSPGPYRQRRVVVCDLQPYERCVPPNPFYWILGRSPVKYIIRQTDRPRDWRKERKETAHESAPAARESHGYLSCLPRLWNENKIASVGAAAT